jgi:hypothetical protein
LKGICTGKYFSETGLIGLIEQAAVFLMHSQNYEVANQLYKILIPIYESHHDIKKLSQVHSKLHDCFNKILLNGSRRLFGTYFRVGFYGYRFEDINGVRVSFFKSHVISIGIILFFSILGRIHL